MTIDEKAKMYHGAILRAIRKLEEPLDTEKTHLMVRRELAMYLRGILGEVDNEP